MSGLSSCIKDDAEPNHGRGETFYFQVDMEPSLEEMRAATVDGTEKENKIAQLWMFIFKDENASPIFKAKCTQVNASSQTYKAVVSSSEDQTALQTNSGPWTIVLVANQDMSTFNPASLASIQDKLVKVSNLYSNFETIPMYGSVKNISIDYPNKSIIETSIPLVRTLCKVLVNKPNVSISGSVVKKVETAIVNYADEGYLGKDEPYLDAKLYPVNPTPEHPSNIVYTDLTSLDNSSFYSFPTSWAGSRLNQLAVRYKITYSKNGQPDQASYYIAPLTINGEKTMRNFVYKISATINRLGSPDEGHPVILVRDFVKVDAWKWTEQNADIDARAFLYFTNRNIKLLEDHCTVGIKTSSRITSMEVSECYYIYAEGGENATPSLHRVDMKKTGNQDPDYNSQYPVIDYNDRELTVQANVPFNYLPKTIIIKAKNLENKEDVLKIVQYPPIYVSMENATQSSFQSVASVYQARGMIGSYSAPKNTTDFQIRILSMPKPEVFKDADNKSFSFKLGFPNLVYQSFYAWLRNSPSQPFVFTEFKYNKESGVVGRDDYATYNPIYGKVTSDNSYTASMISPAFEVSSQLNKWFQNVPYTYLQGSKAEDAIVGIEYEKIPGAHLAAYQYYGDQNSNDQPNNKYLDFSEWNPLVTCASYWELRTINGHPTLVAGWRVPTRAELKLIFKLQQDPKSAIKSILSNNWYWAADKAYKPENISPTSTTKVAAYTRCVRDLKNINDDNF